MRMIIIVLHPHQNVVAKLEKYVLENIKEILKLHQNRKLYLKQIKRNLHLNLSYKKKIKINVLLRKLKKLHLINQKDDLVKKCHK